MDYQVKLDVFEGPLDLLLYLIRKEKVDIYDIPISLITERYMQYLDLLREMNVDVTGDFLVMAAQLTFIKSRMLLPDDGEAENEEEGEDPREELVRRLLDYLKYKSATTKLLDRDLLGRDVFTREAPPEKQEAEESIEEAGLLELVWAFRSVMERAPAAQKSHRVTGRRITVREMIGNLCRRLKASERVVFEKLFDENATRNELVVTFMAILELVRLKVLRVRQEEERGAIEIEVTPRIEEAEGLLETTTISYGGEPAPDAGGEEAVPAGTPEKGDNAAEEE